MCEHVKAYLIDAGCGWLEDASFAAWQFTTASTHLQALADFLQVTAMQICCTLTEWLVVAGEVGGVAVVLLAA